MAVHYLHDPAGTGADVTLAFASYNAASQLLGKTVNNDSYAWTAHHDADLDTAANGLNQLDPAGTNYIYDANGNLSSDGSTTYTYDVEDRLVASMVLFAGPFVTYRKRLEGCSVMRIAPSAGAPVAYGLPAISVRSPITA